MKIHFKEFFQILFGKKIIWVLALTLKKIAVQNHQHQNRSLPYTHTHTHTHTQ